ncbi:MAG: hypothetical protein LBI28_05225 [Treponema sp.]|nr:hypothetical protein [Treponema sp.]
MKKKKRDNICFYYGNSGLRLAGSCVIKMALHYSTVKITAKTPINM